MASVRRALEHRSGRVLTAIEESPFRSGSAHTLQASSAIRVWGDRIRRMDLMGTGRALPSRECQRMASPQSRGRSAMTTRCFAMGGLMPTTSNRPTSSCGLGGVGRGRAFRSRRPDRCRGSKRARLTPKTFAHETAEQLRAWLSRCRRRNAKCPRTTDEILPYSRGKRSNNDDGCRRTRSTMAQSWRSARGIQKASGTTDVTVRRVFPPDRQSKLAFRRESSSATTTSRTRVGVSARRATKRKIENADLRSAETPHEYPCLRCGDGLARQEGCAARRLGWHPFPGRRHQQPPTRPFRVRLSGLLRARGCPQRKGSTEGRPSQAAEDGKSCRDEAKRHEVNVDSNGGDGRDVCKRD